MYKWEPYQKLTGWLLERAGVRRIAVDGVFEALGVEGHKIPADFEMAQEYRRIIEWFLHPQGNKSAEAAYAGSILMSACDSSDIPSLIKLLDAPNGWIRIDSARTLMYLNAQEARANNYTLKNAKDDLDYGVDGDFRRFKDIQSIKAVNGTPELPGFGYDEISDLSPRHKEAWIRLLGGLKSEVAVPVLVDYLNNARNANEIQYAAAQALYEIGNAEAMRALQKAEQNHPIGVVKVLAREAVWAK